MKKAAIPLLCLFAGAAVGFFLRGAYDGTPAPMESAGTPSSVLEVRKLAAVHVAADFAFITWESSRPAVALITYGKGDNLVIRKPLGDTPRTAHAALLTGLEYNTKYSFQVTLEGAGGRVTSGIESVTTGAVTPFSNVAYSVQAFTETVGRAGSEGAGWFDYNNDGFYDLALGGKRLRIFRNIDGTKFKEVTGGFKLDGGAGVRAVSFADIEGDGFADIFTSGGGAIRLYRNSGPPDWTFENVTRRLTKELGDFNYNTEGAGFIDYDGNGTPDILVSNERGMILFKNAPGGFIDGSHLAGLGHTASFGVGNGDFLTIADYNGDGFPDFLYNLDGGTLGHNDGDGGFSREKASGVRYEAGNEYKLGAAFGDFDNDGDLDLFVPQKGKNRLFRNDGARGFRDVTATAGDLAAREEPSRSALWLDVNMDGLLDLYVGNDGENRLYINRGDGLFGDRTAAYGAGDKGKARGMAAADFDNDGDLDIFVNNDGGLNAFYLNNTASKGFKNCLAVRVKGPDGAAGAAVRLFDRDKKLVAARQIITAANWGSQDAPVAWFAAPPGRYTVKVLFTNGTERRREAAVGNTGPNAVTVGEEDLKTERPKRKAKPLLMGGGKPIF